MAKIPLFLYGEGTGMNENLAGLENVRDTILFLDGINPFANLCRHLPVIQALEIHANQSGILGGFLGELQESLVQEPPGQIIGGTAGGLR